MLYTEGEGKQCLVDGFWWPRFADLRTHTHGSGGVACHPMAGYFVLFVFLGSSSSPGLDWRSNIKAIFIYV